MSPFGILYSNQPLFYTLVLLSSFLASPRRVGIRLAGRLTLFPVRHLPVAFLSPFIFSPRPLSLLPRLSHLGALPPQVRHLCVRQRYAVRVTQVFDLDDHGAHRVSVLVAGQKDRRLGRVSARCGGCPLLSLLQPRVDGVVHVLEDDA